MDSQETTVDNIEIINTHGTQCVSEALIHFKYWVIYKYEYPILTIHR